MKNLVFKPYLIFWVTVPFVILMGFIGADNLYQYNFKGVQVILSEINVAILLAIIFELIGAGYWILRVRNRPYSRFLGILHVFLTVGGVLILSLSVLEGQFQTNFIDVPATQILMVVIVAQFLFPVNLWIGYGKDRLIRNN